MRQNVSLHTSVSTRDIPRFDIHSGFINPNGTQHFVELDNSGIPSSRRQIQLGLRYLIKYSQALKKEISPTTLAGAFLLLELCILEANNKPWKLYKTFILI